MGGLPLEHLGAFLGLRPHPDDDLLRRPARAVESLAYEPPRPVAPPPLVVTCTYCRSRHHLRAVGASCPGCGAALPLEAS